MKNVDFLATNTNPSQKKNAEEELKTLNIMGFWQ